MTYLTRLTEGLLQRSLEVQPATIVQGARQVGKSTLVRNHPALREFGYLTLDSTEHREQATENPAAFLGRGERLIIDEIQLVPDLLLALKELIDRHRTPGRFVLSGSANLLSARVAGESLAGRASYVTLWPLTRREQRGLGRAGRWNELIETAVALWPELLRSGPHEPVDWRDAVLRSGYPVPATGAMSSDQQAIWLDGYADTYVDRDVRELAQIARPLDMRRLMRVVSVSIGQLENQARWGQLTGMKRSTVSRYLDLLEVSFQLIRVPAYAVNRTKRLARSPKVFWSDTAFALRLGALSEPAGFHLENLVLTDLVAWSASLARRPTILHWRTVAGDEVDFVIELPDGRLIPVEVKAQPRPAWSDARALQLFLDEYDASLGGLVLHVGDEVYRLSDRIVAAPWWSVV